MTAVSVPIVAPSVASLDLTAQALRNIGLFAHVDAGKTTLTEAVLQLTGAKHSVGRVDDGNTTTDFLDLERERGITISAAAVNTEWSNHAISIVDTPGHADFTMEVERSAMVMDGAVIILDGRKGVEAQTRTVWDQSDRYGVPRILFINKLDMVSDPDAVMRSIDRILGVTACLVQYPVMRSGRIDEIVDLTDPSINFERTIGGDEAVEASLLREQLIEKLADLDETLMEAVMEDAAIDSTAIKDAIRRQTHALNFFPVFAGSAQSNMGVEQLADGIVEFLPSPLQKENPKVRVAADDSADEAVAVVTSSEEPLVARAFKNMQGTGGDRVYLRVYSGKVKAGDTVLNTATNQEVRLQRMFVLNGNTEEQVAEAGPGQIVGVVGNKPIPTGSTLCLPNQPRFLDSLVIPEPVMSYAIRPIKQTESAKLGEALRAITLDDPSVRVRHNEETGQMIVEGMGDLHLDYVAHRLRKEFNVDFRASHPRIAYQLRLQDGVTVEYLHKKQTGGAGQFAKVEIEFSTGPGRELVFTNTITGGDVPAKLIPAVEKGLRLATESHYELKLPVTGVQAKLIGGKHHEEDSNGPAFQIAGSRALTEAMNQVGIVPYEPVMKVEIVVTQERSGSAQSLIGQRTGQVQEVTTLGRDMVMIKAAAPLSKLRGFSEDLKSASAGTGSATLELGSFEPVPSGERRSVMNMLGEWAKDSGSK